MVGSRKLKSELQNKVIVENKLLAYGFSGSHHRYQYHFPLQESSFIMQVIVDNGEMTSKVVDISTNEEYLLVDIDQVSGKFLGAIKKEYEGKLANIIDRCSDMNVFKSPYSKLVIDYVKYKYQEELEYLWLKLKSNNAIVRHVGDKKWYMVLLTIKESKLRLPSDKIVEIINLKNSPEEILRLVDNQKYFRAFHMNKKHWFTIKLDGSVNIERIFEYIDISYRL